MLSKLRKCQVRWPLKELALNSYHCTHLCLELIKMACLAPGFWSLSQTPYSWLPVWIWAFLIWFWVGRGSTPVSCAWPREHPWRGMVEAPDWAPWDRVFRMEMNRLLPSVVNGNFPCTAQEYASFCPTRWHDRYSQTFHSYAAGQPVATWENSTLFDLVKFWFRGVWPFKNTPVMSFYS